MTNQSPEELAERLIAEVVKECEMAEDLARTLVDDWESLSYEERQRQLILCDELVAEILEEERQVKEKA